MPTPIEYTTKLDRFLLKRRTKDEFVESEHPRGQPENAGQFAEKTGQQKSSEKEPTKKKSAPKVYVNPITTSKAKKLAADLELPIEEKKLPSGDLRFSYSPSQQKIFVPEEKVLKRYNVTPFEFESSIYHELGHALDKAHMLTGSSHFLRGISTGNYTEKFKSVLEKNKEWILSGRKKVELSVDYVYRDENGKKQHIRDLDTVMTASFISDNHKLMFARKYADAVDQAKRYMEQPIELFAEGFSRYFLKRDEMKEKAPDLYKTYETIVKENPKVNEHDRNKNIEQGELFKDSAMSDEDNSPRMFFHMEYDATEEKPTAVLDSFLAKRKTKDSVSWNLVAPMTWESSNGVWKIEAENRGGRSYVYWLTKNGDQFKRKMFSLPEDAKRYVNSLPTQDAQVHAPKGGVTVKGKRFVGGQFIPKEGGYQEAFLKMKGQQPDQEEKQPTEQPAEKEEQQTQQPALGTAEDLYKALSKSKTPVYSGPDSVFANKDLRNIDWDNPSLKIFSDNGAHYYKNFAWCDFSGSNLEGVKFPGGTHLNGANFTGCNLKNVDFGYCQLLKANFTDADITDANFTGATYLKEAKLENARCSHLNTENKVMFDSMSVDNAVFGGEETEDLSQEDAAKNKNVVGRLLSKVTGVSRGDVRKFIDVWAGTSGDSCVEAVSAQLIAKELFALDNACVDHFNEHAVELVETYKKAVGDNLKKVIAAQYDQTQKWFAKNGYKPNDKILLYRGLMTGKEFHSQENERFNSYSLEDRTALLILRKPDDYSIEELNKASKQFLKSHTNEEMVKAIGGNKSEEINTNTKKENVIGKAQLQPMSSFSIDYEVAKDFGRHGGKILAAVIPVRDIFSHPKTGYGCTREKEFVVLGGVKKFVDVTKDTDNIKYLFEDEKTQDAVNEPLNIDADLINADWTKQSWDLPEIGTPEFSEFLENSGMTMEHFKTLPVYKHKYSPEKNRQYLDQFLQKRTTDEQVHAPTGGVTIKGKFFKGGEFIPAQGGYAAEYKKQQTAKKEPESKSPIVFYRGTVPGETKRIKEPFESAKGKTFVARKPESARMYGEHIEKIEALPTAKILYQESPDFWKLIGKRRPPNGSIFSLKGVVKENISDAIKKAEEAGYDAISFSSDSDVGTVILNEKAFKREQDNQQPKITEVDKFLLQKKIKRNNNLYKIFDEHIKSGPLDGGCYAMAKALQNKLGGELYSLTSNKQAEHVVLKHGNDYWDGDGKSTQEQLLKRWEKEEGVKNPSLRPFNENDVPESPRDKELIFAVTKYLGGKEQETTQASKVTFTGMDKLDKNQVKLINDLKLSEKQVNDLLSFPGFTVDAHYSFRKSVPGECMVVAKSKNDKGETIDTTISSDIDHPDDLHLNYLEVSTKGTGTAKEYLKRLEAYVSKSGRKTLSLDADISIGRYAWAKMGFEASDPDSLRDMKKHFIPYAKKVLALNGERDYTKELEQIARDVEKFKRVEDVCDYKFPNTEFTHEQLKKAGFENEDVPVDLNMHLGKSYMTNQKLRRFTGYTAVKSVSSVKDSLGSFTVGELETKDEEMKKILIMTDKDNEPKKGQSDFEFHKDILLETVSDKKTSLDASSVFDAFLSKRKKVTTDEFVESEHPRGQPENAGQFVKKTEQTKYSEEEMSIANKTSRTSGAVGSNAIVPRYVKSIADPKDSILDFGAGKDAVHAKMLKEAGLNVTAYEFGSNSKEGLHDPDALKKKYDLVYASNVLNVQSSEKMLRNTLEEIKNSLNENGRVVFNFPESPRKSDLKSADVATVIKDVFGVAPERVGGTSSAPMWKVESKKETSKESTQSPEVLKEKATKKYGEKFVQAVENTEGAKITPEGLELDIARFQKPEQHGEESVRKGVFYLPEKKSPYRKYYSSGKTGYGGGDLITGHTVYKNPMIIEAGTGGRGVTKAYDQVKGKNAYENMRKDILNKVLGWGKTQGQKIQGVYDVIKKYGGEPDMADEIVRVSTQGNTLAYAVQEHIAGEAIRKAGYDAVICHSKAEGKPRLSEVFDLRQEFYPEPDQTDFSNEEFYENHKLSSKFIDRQKVLDSYLKKRTTDEQVHAPKGGVTVKGKKFKGGEFIPSEGGYAAEYKKMTKSKEGPVEGATEQISKKWATPEKLKENFQLPGDLSNIKNWKARIAEGNNLREGQKIGDTDSVGYVMFSLDSDLIIPIARADEHQQGYALLSEYRRKGLVPKEKFVPVFTLSVDFVYEEDKAEKLAGYKKYLKAGGDPNLRIAAGAGSGDYLGTVKDFVDRGGDFKINKGELAVLGKQLTSKLEDFTKEHLKSLSEKNPRTKEQIQKKLGERALQLISNCRKDGYYLEDYSKTKILTRDMLDEWRNRVIKDPNTASDVILGTNGLKNKLHQMIKNRMKMKGYDQKGYKSYFGDLNQALYEFDRLGSLSGKEVNTEDVFKEEDHPRGQPTNKGQFVKKGSETSVSKNKEEKTKGGSELNEHLFIKAVKLVYKKVKGRPDRHEEVACVNGQGELKEVEGQEGQTRIPEDLANEMEYMVHNHPGGAAFSDVDFQFFVAHPKLKRMDVITNDGKTFYTMEKPENFKPDPDFLHLGSFPTNEEIARAAYKKWRTWHDEFFPAFKFRFDKGEPVAELWKEHTNLVMEKLAGEYKFKYEKKNKIDFLNTEDKAVDEEETTTEKQEGDEKMVILDDKTILTPTYETGKLEESNETKDKVLDRYLKRRSTKDALESTSYQGIPIVIENPTGSIRKHPNGLTKMFYPYGYIKKTVGRDGDEIDCFIGPDNYAANVYIVKLAKDDHEDKVMFGFSDERQARDAFLAHYDDYKFLGTITEFPIKQFREILEAKGMKGVNLTKDVLSVQIIINSPDAVAESEEEKKEQPEVAIPSEVYKDFTINQDVATGEFDIFSKGGVLVSRAATLELAKTYIDNVSVG